MVQSGSDPGAEAKTVPSTALSCQPRAECYTYVMSRSFLRRVTAAILTALILAAHLPVPASAAKTMACCGTKACCRPDGACTSGGACATHSSHARAPIDRTHPTLLAGNCGDPTPRVAPVSYDPVTQAQQTAVRVEAASVTLPAPRPATAPAGDTAPSVPPPRA